MIGALLLRFWKPLAAVAAFGILTWVAYSWAYGRGVEATKTHYESLITAAEMAKARAEERSKTVEAAARALDRDLETEDAKRAEAAEVRAATARRDLDAVLVRLNTERARCRQLSEAAAGARSADDTARELQRVRGLVGNAVEIARGCVRDAQRLELWQQRERELQALAE